MGSPSEVPGEGFEDGQRFGDNSAHASLGAEALEDGAMAGEEVLEDGVVADDEYLEDGGSVGGEALEDGGMAGGEALDVDIDMITGVVEAAAEVSVGNGSSLGESASPQSSSRRSSRKRTAAALDPGKDASPRDKVQKTRNVFQFCDDK